MDAPFLHLGPVAESPVSDLSESLDVRLLVTGRLSRTAIDVRHARAELATVLGPAMRRRIDSPITSEPEAIVG